LTRFPAEKSLVQRPSVINAILQSPVVAARLRNGATGVHAAPAARPVLAGIEKEPSASRAGLDPPHRIRHEQPSRCFHDSETQECNTSLFRSDLTCHQNLRGSTIRYHEPACASGFGKVSAEFPEIHVVRRLAREPRLEDPFQQSSKLSESRQFKAWDPLSGEQIVGSSQEAGRFPKANCIGEFTEVVVWLGHVPVVDGIDEVEGRVAAYQFEGMPPDLSHSQSVSPAKAI
jgi:hypothetical protein